MTGSVWRTHVSLSVSLCATLLSLRLTYAQGILGVDPSGRSGENPSLLPERSPAVAPGPVLPPLPQLSPRQTPQLPLLRVFVRAIHVEGNTAFSDGELAKVTAPYLNRELTAEDLEELRVALTRYYVERGYVTSGAIIPDQTVTDGVITLRIVEGKLASIDVGGNRWFRDGYIRSRLALGAGPPVNVYPLQEQLQLLQQDGRIRRVNAELRPGVRPGEATLRVRVEEERPYRLVLGFNNYQSPTVGAERGFVTLLHQNVTGSGDTFGLTYGRSGGVDPLLDVRYALPLTARETLLTLQYRKNDFLVVEEPFAPLDVESSSDIYAVTLSHPLLRTLKHECLVAVTGEHLRNATFLLGEPFSFSAGAQKGKSVVTALRFSLEWLVRTQTQAFAARSRFSLGLDALGATNNRAGVADGQFFAWLGQFQWARRLGAWGLHTIFRLDVQLADAPLLALEQIAVGGRYTVRGYRENTLVRDNGFVASLEARLPVLRDRRWADYLEFAPFVDVGHAWNVRPPGVGPHTIAGIGLGLRWAVTLGSPWRWGPQLELYWGRPAREVRTVGGDLQDDGVHLQLLVTAF